MSYKKKYRDLCKKQDLIPIFSQDWWLDAACGINNWDVILVEKNGVVEASLPYYIFKYFNCINFIKMPMLTPQSMGLWINYPKDCGTSSKLSFEKKVMFEVIGKLPKFHYFCQHFHHSFSNWLPFYWKGFKQTTRYTYLLTELSDLDKVFSKFSPSKRNHIKNAEKIVEVRENLPPEEFYINHKMTLKKHGRNICYDYTLFKNIHDAAYSRSFGKTWYALDAKSNIHSAIFVVFDKKEAYFLISTIDPDFRNSGSASLLLWKAIQYCSGKKLIFNFEGSMIENVEHTFRAFGAEQVPYFRISKKNKIPITNGLLEIERIKNILMKKV